MNFLLGFSKIHQIFLYKLFSTVVRTERDGHYETNFKILLSYYKCDAHLQKTCEISGPLTDSGADITLFFVRWTQIHTRSIGWHKSL